MDSKIQSKPIDLRAFTVTDAFWKNEMELVRTEVIPYQWNALNDKVPGAAPSFCMRNFKLAGKINAERKRQGSGYIEKIWPTDQWETLPKDPQNPEDRFYGWVFQDSDFSKWIEAVGYSLTQSPDPDLEALADSAIDTVCAAQAENGYLDTHYIINDMSQIFTNLKDRHELYCFGHLVEGAVAYYQATGKDKLLKAAQKYADYVYSVFGAEEGKKKGYPGHEIAEMALIRLYEVTGDPKYRELSEFFINERGKKPYYFDLENPGITPAAEGEERYAYNQANRPVREQTEATGHAVRAVYLYSGMADVARVTGDESLYAACERLWNNITKKRMYITGGVGSTHMGEAFTFDYDLPNDTAYAETCAAIGLVFFARRMLEIKPSTKYSDIMERSLYNAVLSGMAMDGKSFFYVNPLEVNPEACKRDERKFHVKPVRQKWFGCACCPPNIARLLSSIVTYAYTENDDTLFVHLYIGGDMHKEFSNGAVNFHIESGFPWDGKVKITASCESKATGTMALRIPGWCKNPVVPDGYEIKDGYLYVTREWKNGDEIALYFPMDIRIMAANTNIREDSGKLCVMRGPLVYCLEETDNGKDLQNLLLEAEKPLVCEDITINGVEMVGIEASGLRARTSAPDDELYTEYKPLEADAVTLHFIPYYAWNNRGEGEMTVWM